MSGESSGRQVIALLGRADSPTDGVQDYCAWLGRALAARGWELAAVRLPWAERGWLGSLRWLRQQSTAWRGHWVLVQYTALSWSRRGFPLGLLATLRALKESGTPCAVVFHDAVGYGGQRLIDRLRRACQHAVMRMAYDWTHRSILTVPLEKVPWLPAWPVKAAFIPVGANLPELQAEAKAEKPADRAKTVAVFGVTGGQHTLREAGDIAYAVSWAARLFPELRLVVLGRDSEEAKDALARALNGAQVRLSVLGLLPPEQIKRTLSVADALLFVRGQVSSRRSSAIAGIACGLPVVGYAGSETGFPITEAGVVLVPQGDREALAEALGRVLADEAYHRELRQRSVAAQEKYFSWDVIARNFQAVLRDG